MGSLRFAIAKNAISNVIRGAASAIVAIVLPHFLTHALGRDRFAGWALMLQLAAYANYLDFGLQTAVARYLAAALERNDRDERDRLLSSATALLAGAGIIAILGLGVVAWQFPHLFHSAPLALTGEIRAGVVILGVSAALSFPLSAYSAALVGMQRNEFPALAAGGSRILGAVAVVVAVQHTQSLAWLALLIGGFNLAGGIAQYAIARNLLRDYRFRRAALDGATIKELTKYCSTLTVWSFSMLLVSGLDVTIVGLFDFKATGAYSLAATLIMFFTGLNSSAFSAMLAPVAVMQERKEYARIKRLVFVTTRLGSYLSLAVVAITFLFGRRLVLMWVGPSYLAITLPVFEILVIAQAVRLTGSAFGTMLVGMGYQRYGTIAALVEGLSNLSLSVLGMIWLGPSGVAWATLIAAIIAMGTLIFAVIYRIAELRINRWSFISQGMLIPLVPFLPLFVWLAIRGWCIRSFSITNRIEVAPTILLCLLTVALIKRGIEGAQRLTL